MTEIDLRWKQTVQNNIVCTNTNRSPSVLLAFKQISTRKAADSEIFLDLRSKPVQLQLYIENKQNMRSH